MAANFPISKMPTGVNLDRPTVQARSLNEFVYTVVMTMSKEQKESLPSHLRRYTSTQKRFQNFLQKSNIDQKWELLTHANISTFLVAAPMGINGNRDADEVIKKYKIGNIQEGLRQAVKIGLFVSADTDLTHALGRMSNTMNGIPYIQNLELKRAAELTRKWAKRTPKSDDVDDDDMEQIILMLLWSGINWEQSVSAVGLEADHLKMILYMYARRNRFLTKDSIDSFFSGIIPASRMKGIYVALRQMMLVQNHFADNKTGYKITPKGIRVCNQFRDRILKSINF